MVENRFNSAKGCTKAGGSKSKIVGGKDVFIQTPALVSKAQHRILRTRLGGSKQRKRALFTWKNCAYLGGVRSTREKGHTAEGERFGYIYLLTISFWYTWSLTPHLIDRLYSLCPPVMARLYFTTEILKAYNNYLLRTTFYLLPWSCWPSAITKNVRHWMKLTTGVSYHRLSSLIFFFFFCVPWIILGLETRYSSLWMNKGGCVQHRKFPYAITRLGRLNNDNITWVINAPDT